MPKQLKRYSLNKTKAFIYFKDTLKDGNTLSLELLRSLDFDQGNFFTLLPLDADTKKIYEFQLGGILLQNKIQENFDETGKKSYFSWTPTFKIELAQLIIEKMRTNINLACIFEDILRAPKDSNLFFDLYGMQYLNEVYYCLNSNASTEEIVTGINRSNAIWHQVFILTETINPISNQKQINLDEIKNFCLRTRLLFIGAYDGEGFVFWEPNDTISSL